MERRKIQIVGGSTYSITLPKRWAIAHNLRASDEVFIEETPDSNLIISTEPNRMIGSNSGSMSLDGNDSFPRTLFSYYYYGFEHITITSSTTIKPATRKRIRRIVSSLLGAQIITESEKRIEIEVIIDRTRIDLRQILHRMSLLIHESIESIATGDHESVTLNEDEIDRLYHLSQRAITMVTRDSSLLASSGIPTQATIPSFFMISKRLESIGDDLTALGNGDHDYLSRVSTQITKSIRHLLKTDMPLFTGLGLSPYPGPKDGDEVERSTYERIWRKVIDVHGLVSDISIMVSISNGKREP
jgi:phosphate uptake regulator